ncbi:MAG: tetratricopeptide repeat protein [Blastocatellia bacterium]
MAASLDDIATFFLADDEPDRYTQAEQIYARALAIRENALGADHPDVARSLDKLAMTYRAQGRYAQAKPLDRRALSIREKALEINAKTLGPDHPDVVTSLEDLAGHYYRQGRYEQAEPLYKRALAIGEKALAINEQALGPDHPDVIRSLEGIAALTSEIDRISGAKEFKKAAGYGIHPIRRPYPHPARAIRRRLKRSDRVDTTFTPRKPA